MSFRYRQVHIEAGDILDPRDWNKNLAEFTGEWNTHIDRDNLPEGSVDTANVEIGAFNYDDSDAYDNTEVVVLDGYNVGWVDSDANYSIGAITYEAPTDGVMVVEWSGTWDWTDISFNGAVDDDTGVRFKITVDGVEVARTGWSCPYRLLDSTYIVAATPVQAGVRVVKVWAQSVDINAANSQPQADLAGVKLTISYRELYMNFKAR